MARIVLGIGTAHSPMVSEPTEYWPLHGGSERERPQPVAVAFAGGDWNELASRKAAWIDRELTKEKMDERYAATQRGVAVVAETLQRVNPDVMIIVGDDQDDIYPHEAMMPAISVYRGESIINAPRDLSRRAEWQRSSAWGYFPLDAPEIYPCDADLANHLVGSLIDQGFDVAHVTTPPEGRHVGHAFTFVHRRLTNERQIPSIPVMLNTYFPPNQPTVRRSYALGKAIRKAVESYPEDKRVAIVASGGLTHPVLDEEFDRKVLDLLAANDMKGLLAMDESIFVLGTSETKNWIAVGAAMEESGFNMKLIDYIPAYRSEAGTGCGLAFAEWT